MSIVYDLLVENKISNNIKTVKRMYNSLLRESKRDLAVFKNEFQTLNETTNVDDSELRRSFKQVSDCLKEAKALVVEAEGTKSLKEQQKAIRKAHRVVREGQTLREALMEDFSQTVDQVQMVHASITEGDERPYICVHAKKGKHECTASSSYGAAQKAANHWNLKSTSGIDAHLADVEKSTASL